MTVLRFAKYHGLGNDFVVLDRLDGAEGLSAEQVRRICDRHTGVGADGVLTLKPADDADARMLVQNADGSEAIMCANGLRCVLRFLYETGVVSADRRELRVAVGAGVYSCVRLDTDRYEVALDPPQDLRDVEVEVEGRRFAAIRLSLGNPHAVIFCDDGELPASLAARYGSILERHPSFGERINVSFARGVDGGYEAAVFERGVGLTQACGSAACAIVAAAVHLKEWSADIAATVVLPGGSLQICVTKDGITMIGEAVRVFEGTVELES